MAAGTGSSRREYGEAAGELHQPPAFGRGLLGLAAASTAITLAASEPPPWLDRDAYFVAISGLFFAGITQVAASVSAGGGRDGLAGRKLVMYASLVVAAGLALAAAASLLL